MCNQPFFKFTDSIPYSLNWCLFSTNWKMAASFFTDRNSNRKQLSKERSCNLRQIRGRSFKVGRCGSNKKKEPAFSNRTISTNRNRKLSQLKATRQTKLDDYLISPLQAKNLLENLPAPNVNASNSSAVSSDLSEQLESAIKKVPIFSNFVIMIKNFFILVLMSIHFHFPTFSFRMLITKKLHLHQR